jgi:hypothetical protein
LDKKNTSNPKYSFNKQFNKNKIMVNNVLIDLDKIASTPGPSNYNTSNKYNNLSSTKKAPSYSIYGKNYSKTNLNLPGPGQYELDQKNIKPQGCAISKAKREYNMLSSNYFSTLNTTEGLKNTNTPGPGRYNSEYNSIHKNADKKGFVIGKDKRKITVTNSNTCGPGDYLNEKNMTTFKSRGMAYTLNKAKRPDLYCDTINTTCTTPGPGRYSLTNEATTGKNGKGISFGIKTILSTLESPGPGQYDNDNKNTRPDQIKHKFNNSKKLDPSLYLIGPSSPGPGRYDNSNKMINNSVKNGKSIKIGNDKRFKSDKCVTPGPGEYKLPCSIRNLSSYGDVNKRFDHGFDYV